MSTKNNSKTIFMFGERLKLLRKDKGLTQLELSRKLGVSQGHISALEKNEKSPGSDILISLKQYFKVDLNWLLMGDGPKKLEEQKTGQRKYEILKDAEDWLDEKVQRNPDRKTWFELHLLDSFPEFKEWRRKRDQPESDEDEGVSRKVA